MRSMSRDPKSGEGLRTTTGMRIGGQTRGNGPLICITVAYDFGVYPLAMVRGNTSLSEQGSRSSRSIRFFLEEKSGADWRNEMTPLVFRPHLSPLAM